MYWRCRRRCVQSRKVRWRNAAVGMAALADFTAEALGVLMAEVLGASTAAVSMAFEDRVSAVFAEDSAGAAVPGATRVLDGAGGGTSALASAPIGDGTILTITARPGGVRTLTPILIRIHIRILIGTFITITILPEANAITATRIIAPMAKKTELRKIADLMARLPDRSRQIQPRLKTLPITG